MQIVMAFSVCFAFMAALVALNYVNSLRVARSMAVFELAGELNSTILEMRRFEKNYFLYRQDFNYEENLTYTNRLGLVLQREREMLVTSLGTRNYEHFLAGVYAYAHAMGELHGADCARQDCDALEEKIRAVGQDLLMFADQLLAGERRAINARLRQLIPMPLLSLVVLVILLSFVVFVIGEKVVRPLARITREAEAVASGAFQRITLEVRTHNEIHSLVAAINRMVEELEKRQEQLVQSRKIASIGTLTAGIAHEINNPLNNVSLILESMLEQGGAMGTEECRRLLDEAMGQADRASEIVKNLLEFSRASHRRAERVRLDVLVDRVARLVNNELSLRNVTFKKVVRDELPEIWIDKGGLQQVLLNLFMNAIQAMEGGGLLTVVIGDTGKGEARLDVVDTGPGIAPEHRSRIFDPFFTTKREGEGTGLGLSMSYNIIVKNGGRIEVASEPGRGACFSIYLPLQSPVEARI